MLESEDKLSFKADIQKGDKTGYANTFFTKEFFESSTIPYQIFQRQMNLLIVSSLARFLDKTEEEIHQRLSEVKETEQCQLIGTSISMSK